MNNATDPRFVLRPCEEGDIAAIARIYAEEVRHGRASFELEPPSSEEMTRRWRAILAGGHPYLVAAAGQDVIGYAYASAYRPRPAYMSTVEDSVYVHADWRGRGVAHALLVRLISESEARGFRQMIAVIGDSENISSIRLHEKLGFAHAGVLRSVGWKHGTWLDTVLMQRALGAGADVPSVKS